LNESAPLLVDVMRGGLVESQHRVAACAVDARGRVLFSAGDLEARVYLRSSAKPFIAAAVVQSGAAAKFGLDAREVAVMTGSHAGQPIHVEAVQSILRKIGLDASALQCGVHAPYDEAAAEELRSRGEAPTQLHNNCSGKHAGILALCLTIGADPATYLSAENPAERAILDFCARVSDDDAATWPIGVDGCGIPVYATGLRNAALSFARLASPETVGERDAAALRAVRDAMVAFPEYVAGDGQLDTELMRAGKGSLVSKAGAEGVQGVGVLPQAIGYASKVLDGGARARGPSTIAALRRLNALDASQAELLTRFARPVVYNRAGRKVGEIV
jgi:L-asparaginase II